MQVLQISGECLRENYIHNQFDILTISYNFQILEKFHFEMIA